MPAPPKTVLHQRIVDVSKGLSALQVAVGDTLGGVTQRLQSGINAVHDVGQKVEAVAAQISGLRAGELATVCQRLSRLSSEMVFIQSAILAVAGQEPAEPTPNAFQYIRALNQVEDLVTDHDFSHTKNSAGLTERWNERRTQDCYETLMAADPNLGGRFQAVYGPFLTDEFHERAARYGEVDQLRRDIIRHCGPPSSRPATAPDTDKRRSRRK